MEALTKSDFVEMQEKLATSASDIWTVISSEITTSLQ